MKKLFYLSAALCAALTLASCEKNSIPASSVFTMPDKIYEGQTFQITPVVISQDIFFTYDSEVLSFNYDNTADANGNPIEVTVKEIPAGDSILNTVIKAKCGKDKVEQPFGVYGWTIGVFKGNEEVTALYDGVDYAVNAVEKASRKTIPLSMTFTVSSTGYKEGSFHATDEAAVFTCKAGRDAVITATHGDVKKIAFFKTFN